MKQGPVRTCVGCGAKRYKKELVRFAVGEGRIRIHNKSGHGGRGWYLCYNKKCAENLAKKGRINRAQSIRKEELKRFVEVFELEVSSEWPER